jgi:glycosyltransferase involved in cell wall biosynthesis
MRILVALTYYHPHISGLTIYVQRLAEALAQRGHDVTVLTSRYRSDLSASDTLNRVEIVRVPVLARVSKGVLMPGFATSAVRLLRRHDVLSIHLPQFEGSLLALLGRLLRRPVVMTYHCDLRLPAGAFNRLVDQVVYASNYLAGALSHRIVTYTHDYAEHSPLLSHFLNKLDVIYPPVTVAQPRPISEADWARRFDLNGSPRIGFAARLATEKGAEYLLKALPMIRQRYPNAQLLFAGEFENVLGEEAYFRRLRPLVETNSRAVHFLGVLDAQAMADFYGALDVLVLPSLNSTESFGLVQVEAMLCGTPVVASNLPGVRQPVTVTGMGEIAPLRDEVALADRILRVLDHPDHYDRPRDEIAAIFNLDRTISAYEKLFAAQVAAAP